MAITGGDWSSATDPFLLADDIAYTGTVTNWTYNRIQLSDAEGFLNGVIDKDIQDLFWQKDGDTSRSFSVNATQKPASDIAAGYEEFGDFDEDFGGTYVTYNPRSLQPDDATGVHTYIYAGGKSTGAVIYSLYAFVAYQWVEKDPAQIIFSWLAHHLDDEDFTMKDYLNQTSFQDASDYYDDNPINLSCFREAGTKMSDQIQKLMQHTADFLSIRPDPSDGDVELFLHTRRNLTQRTTAINLESRSVKSYTIRPNDRSTLDRIEARFGSVIMINGSGTASSPDQYITAQPVEFPHVSRNTSIQKVGKQTANRKLTVELPYHTGRRYLNSHIDIGFWKDDQDEVEIEFSDWSHLNYETGDLVPIIGEHLDGTENFICTEKTLDIDTLKASARFLKLNGIAGKCPPFVDNGNLISLLRPNTFGYFVDGTQTFPLQVAYKDSARNLDRWWDESYHYSHAQEIDRGTAGPSGGNPDPPSLTLDVLERWPVLDFDGENGMQRRTSTTDGLAGLYQSGPSTPSNLTVYMVVKPDTLASSQAVMDYQAAAGSTRLAFAPFGGGTPGRVQYNQGGSWIGSVGAIFGWQIIVYVLESPTASLIRRNGATIESGLAYTQQALVAANSHSIGVSYDGNSDAFDGQIAEIAVYEAAHTSTEWEAIEAHLAEKYGITLA